MMPSVIASTEPDANGYRRHVLDMPFHGWAHNDTSRIQLNGQESFTLHGEGSVTLTDTEPPEPE